MIMEYCLIIFNHLLECANNKWLINFRINDILNNIIVFTYDPYYEIICTLTLGLTIFLIGLTGCSSYPPLDDKDGLYRLKKFFRNVCHMFLGVGVFSFGVYRFIKWKF